MRLRSRTPARSHTKVQLLAEGRSVSRSGCDGFDGAGMAGVRARTWQRFSVCLVSEGRRVCSLVLVCHYASSPNIMCDTVARRDAPQCGANPAGLVAGVRIQRPEPTRRWLLARTNSFPIYTRQVVSLPCSQAAAVHQARSRRLVPQSAHDHTSNAPLRHPAAMIPKQ